MELNNGISPLVESNTSGEITLLGEPNINPPDCTISDNWVFENFILAYKPFVKALRFF